MFELLFNSQPDLFRQRPMMRIDEIFRLVVIHQARCFFGQPAAVGKKERGAMGFDDVIEGADHFDLIDSAFMDMDLLADSVDRVRYRTQLR